MIQQISAEQNELPATACTAAEKHAPHAASQKEKAIRVLAMLGGYDRKIERKLRLWQAALIKEYGELPDSKQLDHLSLTVMDYMPLGDTGNRPLYNEAIRVLGKCAKTSIAHSSLVLEKMAHPESWCFSGWFPPGYRGG